MWYFIAGSAFLLLTIGWHFIQAGDARKKKFKEAKRDYQKAIDDGDTSAVLDAERRMQLYR